MLHKKVQNIDLNVLIKARGSHIGNKTIKSLLLIDSAQPDPHSPAY